MSSTLNVPGARLFYKTSGTGPLLLLVPAANGDTLLFEPTVPYLTSHFTVCVYDRRGFSRSTLEGEQDYRPAARLARDADDAAALIQHLQPGEPAFVCGSSSGARVSLELLRRHPNLIKGLIAHEPPAALDPQAAERYDKNSGHWREKVKSGESPGFVVDEFSTWFNDEADRECLRKYWKAPTPEREANLRYWILYELEYGSLLLDFEALRERNGQLSLGVGSASKGNFLDQTANAIAEKTGARVVEMAAAHMAYYTHPKEFGESLVKCFGRWMS